MRIALYGRVGYGPLDSLAEGARGRLDVVWRRDAVFTSDQVESFDLVAVHGLRGASAEIRDAYAAKGVPVLVLDLPHLRGTDQVRLSLGSHDWLPEFDCPPQRLRALDLRPPELKKTSRPEVLVLGQLPGDSQHGLSSRQLESWARAQLEAIEAQTSKKVAWRPHPEAPRPLPGFHRFADPSKPLDEDLARARAVVTYNSTAGLEALIAGVPVIAEGPCVYAPLSKEIRDLQRIKAPAVEEVQALLQRIAFTQWTRDELADGTALAFTLACIAGEVPFSEEDFEAMAGNAASNNADDSGIDDEDEGDDTDEGNVANEDDPNATDDNAGSC